MYKTCTDASKHTYESCRNGNQMGVPSYDWDLSYWQATLVKL